MNLTARIVICLVFGVATLVFWWSTGFSFDERGDCAAWCCGTVIIMMFIGFSCPLFDEAN